MIPTRYLVERCRTRCTPCLRLKFQPTRSFTAQAPRLMKLQDFIEKCTLDKPTRAHPHYQSDNSTCTTRSNTQPSIFQGKLILWENFFEQVEEFLAPNLQKDFPTLGFSADDWEGDLKRGQSLTQISAVTEWAIPRLEQPCIKILRAIYGEDFDFEFDGPQRTINIGDPTRVFTSRQVIHGQLGPSGNIFPLVVIHKTPWSLPLEGVDFVNAISSAKGKPLKSYTSILNQMYGYMWFNNLKYGILTTAEATWVFRQVRNRINPNSVILECSPAIYADGQLARSPLAAFVYAGHLIYRENTSRGAFVRLNDKDSKKNKGRGLEFDKNERLSATIPNLKISTGQARRSKRMRFQLGEKIERDGTYFYRGSVYHQSVGVEGGAPVIIKAYDLFNPDAVKELMNQLKLYQKMRDLQARCIPRLFCSGKVGGVIELLILEDHGKSLERYGWSQIPKSQELAVAALSEIHRKGIVHGNISFRNITYDSKTKGELRIGNFEHAKTGILATHESMREEMKMLRLLEPTQEPSSPVKEHNQPGPRYMRDDPMDQPSREIQKCSQESFRQFIAEPVEEEIGTPQPRIRSVLPKFRIRKLPTGGPISST